MDITVKIGSSEEKKLSKTFESKGFVNLLGSTYRIKDKYHTQSMASPEVVFFLEPLGGK